MTSTPAEDESLRCFLRDHIESFEQLEVLLLLSNRRDRDWSKDAIADALRIEGKMTEVALEHLAGKDLIASSTTGAVGASSSYRYQPGTPVLARMATSLMAAWEHSRVEIVKIMTDQAIERIRHQMARAFADGPILGRKKGI